jgi:hypothetical protein
MTTGPGERHAPSFHRSASEIAVVAAQHRPRPQRYEWKPPRLAVISQAAESYTTPSEVA